MDRGLIRVGQHGFRTCHGRAIGPLLARPKPDTFEATIPSSRVAKRFRFQTGPIPTRSILW